MTSMNTPVTLRNVKRMIKNWGQDYRRKALRADFNSSDHLFMSLLIPPITSTTKDYLDGGYIYKCLNIFMALVLVAGGPLATFLVLNIPITELADGNQVVAIIFTGIFLVSLLFIITVSVLMLGALRWMLKNWHAE